MRVIVELDVFIDGMDEEDFSEVLHNVAALIESGAESTASTAYVKDLSFEEDYVVVLKNRLQQLEDDVDTLEALEAAGVDNWSGYSDAMAIKRGEDPWE